VQSAFETLAQNSKLQFVRVWIVRRRDELVRHLRKSLMVVQCFLIELSTLTVGIMVQCQVSIGHEYHHLLSSTPYLVAVPGVEGVS
jgi:hypothetical protein